jgi:hypothetical protein
VGVTVPFLKDFVLRITPPVRHALPYFLFPLATFQPPASLNALQQFGQACAILRNTSRASNSAWYKDALELNFQLHIRMDGVSITTFYHDRQQAAWSPGPTLSDQILLEPALLQSLIAGILKQARANEATALGVILHIADELATTELKPDLNNPAALEELRNAAISDPGSILEDASIQADKASWRVLPYPAAASEVIATAITLSKKYESLINLLRETGENENFPIITLALSAPLVALMGLSTSLTPTPDKPFVAILQYPWFTALAFFNRHADLQLIRTLQHRGLRRPTSLRNAISTTAASLEFDDPDLFLLPLGSRVDSTLDADLRITFTTSRVEIIQQAEVEGIPSWCPEPVISEQSAATELSATASHTFTILQKDKWALQDFLPPTKEAIEMFPSRVEMRLLKIIRLSWVALAASVILSCSYFGYDMIQIMRRSEWTFDPSQAAASKTQLTKLNADRLKAEHWNNLLADRSKAWSNMESLSRMFPEHGGMLISNYTYSAKPDSIPGKTKMGFVKEWKITGYARDEALPYLNTLNTREGVSAHFNEISRITGNTSFSPAAGNRNLIVNIRQQENNAYKPLPLEESSDADQTTYPFAFDITITQRFEATDPLAIDASKVP